MATPPGPVPLGPNGPPRAGPAPGPRQPGASGPPAAPAAAPRPASPAPGGRPNAPPSPHPTGPQRPVSPAAPQSTPASPLPPAARPANAAPHPTGPQRPVSPAAPRPGLASPPAPQSGSGPNPAPQPGSGPAPAGGAGRRRASEVIAKDRRNLGLSEIRPSDQVAGLEEVGKREAKREELERIKQRSGQIIMNEAIHVDERGRRWQRLIRLGVAAVVLVIAGTVGLLFYRVTFQHTDPRELAMETRNVINCYLSAAPQIAPFPADAKLTVEDLKSRLRAVLSEQLAKAEKDARGMEKGHGATSRALAKTIHVLKQALTFRDGSGQPFVFEFKEDDVLAIRSVSLGDDQGPPAEVLIPRGRGGGDAP